MSDVKPSEQCPNCAKWVELGSCYHSSSGPTGTLYGVCQKRAATHAAYSALMRDIIEANRRPKKLWMFDSSPEAQ